MHSVFAVHPPHLNSPKRIRPPLSYWCVYTATDERSSALPAQVVDNLMLVFRHQTAWALAALGVCFAISILLSVMAINYLEG